MLLKMCITSFTQLCVPYGCLLDFQDLQELPAWPDCQIRRLPWVHLQQHLPLLAIQILSPSLLWLAHLHLHRQHSLPKLQPAAALHPLPPPPLALPPSLEAQVCS